MHYWSICVTIIFVALFQLSTFAQCDHDPWTKSYPCDSPLDLPILCDLNELDGDCLDMDDNGFPGDHYYLWNSCGGFTGCVGVWTWFTSFIAHQNYIELQFDVNNCEVLVAPPPQWDSLCIGVRVGIYDVTNGYCNPQEMFVECDCIMEGSSIIGGFSAVPGNQYMIQISPCHNNFCEVETTVLSGGAPSLTEPQTVTPQANSFSTPDSICAGADNVPFEINPDLAPDTEFLVYRNGSLLQSTTNNPVLTDWDVAPGTYDICVAAAGPCDTSDQVCTEVTVAEYPDELHSEVVCAADLPYAFMGESIDSEGTHTVPQTTAAGCTYDAVLELSVIDAAIQTDPVVCENGTYSVSADVTTDPAGAAAEYMWLDDAGAIVGTDLTLTVSTGGTYTLEVTVEYEDQECTFVSAPIQVNPAEHEAQPPNFADPPDTVCVGDTATLSVHPAANATSYNWTIPAAVTLLNGGSGTTVELAFPDEGTYSICVSAQNNCNESIPVCSELVVSGGIAADAGPDTVLCDSTHTLRANSPSGQWMQISGPDSTTFADSLAAVTDITVHSPGTYTYKWTTVGARCPGVDTVAVTFAEPLSYSGITYDCDNNTYTAEVQIEGGTPPYELLSGSGTIDSTGLYTSGPITSGDSVTVELTDSLDCGPLEISLYEQCNCITEAGVMSADTLSTCGTDECFSATVTTTPTLDQDDIIQYALHEGSGNVLSDVIAIQDDSTFCFEAGMNQDQVYYISQIVGTADSTGSVDLEDGCLAVTPGQPVIWHEIPEAEIAPQTIDTCGQQIALTANPSVGDRQWSMLSGPGNAMIDMPTLAATIITVDAYGTYRFEWSENNHGCTDADTVTVSFHGPPEVQGIPQVDCLADTDYVLAFSVEGGTPPYTLIEGEGHFSDSTYIDTLSSGATYNIAIIDSRGCDTLFISGMQDCNCSSTAGELSQQVLDTCHTACVTADYLGGAMPDTDDATAYVLHDLPGDSLGTVIGMNQTGEFCYTDHAAELTTGQTYYISQIVGNAGGEDAVDLSDPCLAVSAGQPVVWYDDPTASVSEPIDTINCFNEEIILDGSPSTAVTGSGLEFEWTDASGTVIGNAEQLTVDEAGDYTLRITDTGSGCTDAVTVTVTESKNLPEVGIAPPEMLSCERTEVTLDGTGSDQGSQFTHSWSSDPPGLPIEGESTLQPTVSEGGSYILTISDQQNGCTNTAAVTVPVDTTSPTAIATVDDELDCSTDTVTIDATGSSQGNNYTYSWSAADLDGLNPTITQAGSYTLTVEDTTNGCTASTTVAVEEDTSRIRTADYQTVSPGCDALSTGQITITEVSGGTAPYTYILNQGQQENQTGLFSGLPAGSYSVEIIDANGCRYELTNITLSAPDGFEIALPPTVTIDRGDSVALTPQISPSDHPINRYRWMSGSDTLAVCADCSVLTVLPSENTVYRLTVTDTSGCTATASVSVLVEDDRDIYIPNAFTPNNDGINDYWTVYTGSEAAVIEEMELFNRWGGKVFDQRGIPANKPALGWDGTADGERMAPAVFVYRVVVRFADGERITRSGNVTLVR